MEAAMGLTSRMPPKHTEPALFALLSLLPYHRAALWFPEIQVLCDMEYGKQFILCVNITETQTLTGKTLRGRLSPWSNKYHPPLEDSSLPSLELRKLEVEANDIFAIYRDQYYEGGISSFYMCEDDNEGSVGCFLIKEDGSKTGQGRRGYLQEGAWDAIHVIEGHSNKQTNKYINSAQARFAYEAVVSTKPSSFSGSTFTKKPLMIEEIESKLRNSLDQVYNGLRIFILGIQIVIDLMVCTLRPPSEVVMRLPDN
ncbi:unnamed protein product [Malus baccata var. baccata]